MNCSWIILILLPTLFCYSTSAIQSRPAVRRYVIRPENVLRRLTMAQIRAREKRRSATSECRWKEATRRLDCKFANLTKLGGLEKVAEKKVRILDLSHCRIRNALILLKGLKEMPFLSQIILDYNKLRKLPVELFQNNRRLRVISLHGNFLTSVPEKIFWRNTMLEMLRLSRNSITFIPRKTFYRSRKLRMLELWENKIQKLHPKLFWNNKMLEYVSLSWNSIKHLPSQLFTRNQRLRTVKAFKNHLRCVSAHQFENNFELKKVNLGFNQLISLPNSIFWNNGKLEDVRLWANRMSCLPTGVFDFNHRLSYVNLLLQRQKPNAQLKNLARTYKGPNGVHVLNHELDLSNTEWCEDDRKYALCKWDSDKKVFNCQSKVLTHLRRIPIPCDVLHLNLADNELADATEIGSMVINMPGLISAKLAGNKLEELPANLFSECNHLEVIDVSQNKIQSLPTDVFSKTVKLQQVILSNNIMKELPHNIFKRNRGLKKIDLARNDIEELSSNLFNENRQLRELYINDNLISDLAEDILQNNALLVKLDLSYNRISYISSVTFSKNLKLEFLNLKKNELSELESFLFRNLLSLKELDMSNNKIESLPENLFQENENLEKVHLNGNHLYTIPLKLFDSNPALNLVSLDANYLADVPEDVFRVNKNLEAIGLQHNCISNVPQQVFMNKPRLREVGLRGNPTLPWQIRRVFEGKQEIRDLRKQLKLLEEEQEMRYSTSYIRTTQLPITAEVEEVQEKKREHIERELIIDGVRVIGGHIPGEIVRDDPSSATENETSNVPTPLGAEQLHAIPALSRNHDGDDWRRKRRRKRDVMSAHDIQLIRSSPDIDEESLDAVCMNIWKKRGLVE